MSEVGILVRYGGVWDENERKYFGGSLKGTIISKQITFKDLVGELYDIAGVDHSKFDMKCIYHLKVENGTPPIVVRNDRDVKFYLRIENILDLPLYLSFEPKHLHVEVNNGLEVCYNSISESNKVQNLNVPIVMAAVDEEEVEIALSDNSPWEYVQMKNLNCEAYDIRRQGGVSIENDKETCEVRYGSASRKTRVKKSIWLEESSTSNELEVGQIFSCKRELSMKLNVMAMKKNFEFSVKKSSKDILYVKCINDKCDWRLRAVKLKGSNLLKISKYVNVHSCSLDILNHDHRQAKSWVVGELIKSKFKEVGRQCKPRDIIEDMRQNFGVNLSYEKAWRSRENAFTRVVAKVGRRKKIRISSVGETRKIHKCGRCNQKGHNRLTCSNPVVYTEKSVVQE